jgi:eukaryotic-like serine/threonine-protein kinase
MRAGLRPTVFIGLGGMAIQTLCALRPRLQRRFAEPSSTPGLRILVLDTDQAELRAIESRQTSERLTGQEMLHLPLRRSADYRSASDEILSWLSRRWLYNIPRSLRTEGLRPLGRLAFVDHRHAIAERISTTLVAALGDDSQRQTSETSKAGPGNVPPRVCVIASIGGGTGGGMLLDVAYAVRQQLGQLDLATDGVHGIMLHATFASRAGNDLRNANAYATLTELNHFMLGGAAYRAGPMEVLPAGDVSEPPFARAYLVHLGDELDQTALNVALESVADYLCLDAIGCNAALDQPHSQKGENSWPADARGLGAHKVSHDSCKLVQLHSFGLHAIRFDKQKVIAREANRLCLRLVRKWLGDREDGLSPSGKVETSDIQLDDLVERLQAIADHALSGSSENHFRALVSAGPDGPSIIRDDDPAGPFGDDLRRIHAVLGLPGETDTPVGNYLPPLESRLRDDAMKLASAIARSLVEAISASADRPRARLPVAIAAVNLWQGRLRDVRRSAEQTWRNDHDQATALWSRLQRGELPGGRTKWLGLFPTAAENPEDFLLEYCRLRLKAMLHKWVINVLQVVAAELTALGDSLARLRQSVQQLAEEFTKAVEEDNPMDKRLSWSEHDLANELDQLGQAEYIEQFDETLQAEYIESHGGLLALNEPAGDGWQALCKELYQRAQTMVADVLDDVDVCQLLIRANPTAGELNSVVRAAAEQAKVRLPKAGSSERLLVVVPQAKTSKLVVEAVRQTLADAVVVASTDPDLLFCHEVEGINLAKAANVLVADRHECAEAALRLFTRVDVPWAALQPG